MEIKHRNITQKRKQEKFNTHIQREVELSSPEISMTEKGPNELYFQINPTPFQNDYPISAQLEKTSKILVVLQPHSVVYPIS